MKVSLMWNADKPLLGMMMGLSSFSSPVFDEILRDARKCSFKAYILIGEMDKKLSNSDNTVGKGKHKKAITWG